MVASDNEEEPPPELVCSITNCLIIIPVVVSDGHTYERSAIEEWMATKLGQVFSPKTGEVRQSEERSDELTAQSKAAKTEHAHSSV